jgi:hypothetical protein
MKIVSFLSNKSALGKALICFKANQFVKRFTNLTFLINNKYDNLINNLIVETPLTSVGGVSFCYNRYMATKIYETETIRLMDGTEVTLTPLKIKYLRGFMDAFEVTKNAVNKVDSIEKLSECVRMSMKQYYPALKTIEDIQDNIDINTMSKIISVAATISNKTGDVKEVDLESNESSSWQQFDLAKIESEAFLLGIWKDYEELESSMSLPELLATLEAKRELEYVDKKFMASLQGVDLEEQSGTAEQDPWEAMKARVAARESGVGSGDPNDITSLQGIRAQQAGFGIGMGLDYEVVNG